MRALTHEILDWTEEKFDDILENIDKEKHPYAKSFALGAIEGIIDGSVVIGLFVAGIGLVKGIKTITKK